MAPTPCIDSVEENVIKLDNFSIHVFTPKSYTGLHGAIIAIHGGGWMLGDVLSVRRLYSNIADEAGAVVVAPDYRLAPENVYDAGIDDCLETVKYVFDHADELNIDPNKIILTGESAGGHLTLVTALGLVGTEYTLKGTLSLLKVNIVHNRYTSILKTVLLRNFTGISSNTRCQCTNAVLLCKR